MVLGEVVDTCDLNTEWGRKYASGEKLKTSESLTILRGRLDVRPVRNTSIISVRAYSEDKEEAAMVANAVMVAYQNQVGKVSPTVSAIVIDRALPGLRPVRPNKPLNIALGIVVGAVLGAGSAALVTALAANYRGRHRAPRPPPPEAGLKSIH
jgi:capsular polysaccharide biosynthesis protein